MKKYVYQVIVNPTMTVHEEQNWLNKMAEEGWRLIAVNNTKRYFEKEIIEPRDYTGPK